MVSGMQWRRFLAHLSTTRLRLRRSFPDATLSAIEREITRGESTHDGELRFAIEVALHPLAALRGQPARDRAVTLFANLGVWDTAANNGVLIYVLLADHCVEIVADRGYNGRVTATEWAGVCHLMERAFAASGYEAGALEGVRAASAIIARFYPPTGDGRNELPDRPVVL
jgi:uncharacterized membrane protein